MRSQTKIIVICALIAVAAMSVGASYEDALEGSAEIDAIYEDEAYDTDLSVPTEEIISQECETQETDGGLPAWTKRMYEVHEMAETARSWGLPESDPIIVRLSEIWWSEYSDLRMIAKTISKEAPYCPYWHQVTVGAIVLNRVDDPRFPDTVYGVLTQANPLQYSPSYTYNFTGISAQHYQAAIDAIDGNHDVPANVVWQAEFVQGRGIWRTSYVNTGYYSSTTYFCY